MNLYLSPTPLCFEKAGSGSNDCRARANPGVLVPGKLQLLLISACSGWLWLGGSAQSLSTAAVAGSQQYHQQQKTNRRLLGPPRRSSHVAREVCRGYSPRLYHRQGAEAEDTPAKLQSIPGGA